MFCDYCYKDCEAKKCSKCLKRNYCSKKCQIKDWRIHKSFCNKSGEFNYEIEISKSKCGFGFGVYAKKQFEVNDIIFYERCLFESEEILKNNIPDCSIETFEKFKELTPLDGTLADKIKNNQFYADNRYTNKIICFLISRINHHCIGNTSHFYDTNKKVMIIFATKKINIGDELTFSYTRLLLNREQRKTITNRNWNFVCNCGNELHEDLENIMNLENDLNGYIIKDKLEKALETEKKITRLYKKYDLESNCIKIYKLLLNYCNEFLYENWESYYENKIKDLDNTQIDLSAFIK